MESLSYLNCKQTVHLTTRWSGIRNDMDLIASLQQIYNCLLDTDMSLQKQHNFANFNAKQ